MKGMKDFIVNKIAAKEIYDSIVEENIRNNLKVFKDPDIPYEDTMIIEKSVVHEENKIDITMSADGLCSVRKIQLMCENDECLILEKYILLRKGMFDCLKWPSYALSINRLRANKAINDRIDLTLADIQRFYEVIYQKKPSLELFCDILNNRQLKLRYAYYNIMTFSWLKQFEDFENFIIQNNLMEFIKMENGKVVPWISEKYTNTFCKEYFAELCDRAYSYKENNNIEV